MDISELALKALNKGKGAFYNWLEKNTDIRIDFKGLNLEGKDFYLIGKNGRRLLKNIDFGGANLSEANFHFLQIENCNFDGAIATNASFSKSHFKSCSFRNAQLYGASFHRAIVDGVDFTGADLRDVNFTVKSCEGSILKNARIKGMEIQTTWHGYPWDEWPENLLFAQDLHLVAPEDQHVVLDYVSIIFTTHYKDVKKEDYNDKEFFDRVVNKINFLTGLYSEPEIPVSLLEIVQKINTELIAYLQKHPKHLHNLHWRAFEELVAELLASFGWYVELTSPTKDNGYDIFAIYKDVSGIRHNWIIECKKYDESRKVGIDIVRSLYGVKTDLKVGNALLATTSSFTEGVNIFKGSHYDLETKDFNGIVEWINHYKMNDKGLYIKDNRIELLDSKSSPIQLPGKN